MMKRNFMCILTKPFSNYWKPNYGIKYESQVDAIYFPCLMPCSMIDFLSCVALSFSYTRRVPG